MLFAGGADALWRHHILERHNGIDMNVMMVIRRARTVLAWLAPSLLAVSCGAAEYYFSSVGSDITGNGTLASPWQSIGKFNTLNLNAGDSVYFRAGDTFAGNMLLDANDSATNMVGVYGNVPLTISSYGSGNRPIISSPTGHGLRATNVGGLEIRGLELSGVTATGSITSLSNTTKGLFFENAGTSFRQQHIQLEDLVVHGFGQDGINFHATNPMQNSGGFSSVSIVDTEVYSNGRSGISSSASSSNGSIVGGSLYDFQSRAHSDFHLAGNVVRNTTGKSEASGVSGNGIVLAQIDGAVIERNVAHHNGGVAGGGGVGIWTWEANDVAIQFNEAYANNSFDGRDGGGFDLDGGVTNSVMQYNYSHGNHGAGLGLFEFGYASPMSRNVIRYNVSEADGGGISVWGAGPRYDGTGAIDTAEDSIYHNNTIIRPTGPAIYFFGRVDDVGVYNNLVVTENGRAAVRADDWDGVGGDYFVDVQLAGNAYWPGSGPFLANWNGTNYNSVAAWANATGQEKIAGSLVGVQVDPQLLGPLTGGVTLNDPALLSGLTEYRLLASSALVNAGVDLASVPLAVALGLTDPGEHDFFGNFVRVGELDIGAHEQSLPGDFNADGAVDAADYVVWRKVAGTNYNPYADANGDRTIDEADFANWRAHFGSTLGGSGSGGFHAIPEPSFGLLIVAFALVVTVSRRFQLS
jgi:hypothetical protein